MIDRDDERDHDRDDDFLFSYPSRLLWLSPVAPVTTVAKTN